LKKFVENSVTTEGNKFAHEAIVALESMATPVAEIITLAA